MGTLSVGQAVYQLNAEERAVLRSLGQNGEYHQSQSGFMSYCMSPLGMFSRLEECGANGWATLTDFGREVIAKLKAPSRGTP